MSNLFKYKITLNPELAMEEKHQLPSQHTVFYLALILVCTATTTSFLAIVMILNYCFSSSLNGTYLKLFF